MMQKSKEGSGNESETRLVSEIKQPSALEAWCTPEFLIQSSQTVQSTARVGEPGSLPSSTVSGRYLASCVPLAGYGQVERLIGELQAWLDAECEGSDSANGDDLLYLWMSVERSLTADEHRRLLPVVLKRLFPESKAPSHLSRDGAQQLGGH
jgi:hypothetical protein